MTLSRNRPPDRDALNDFLARQNLSPVQLENKRRYCDAQGYPIPDRSTPPPPKDAFWCEFTRNPGLRLVGTHYSISPEDNTGGVPSICDGAIVLAHHHNNCCSLEAFVEADPSTKSWIHRTISPLFGTNYKATAADLHTLESQWWDVKPHLVLAPRYVAACALLTKPRKDGPLYTAFYIPVRDGLCVCQVKEEILDDEGLAYYENRYRSIEPFRDFAIVGA